MLRRAIPVKYFEIMIQEIEISRCSHQLVDIAISHHIADSLNVATLHRLARVECARMFGQ